MVVQYAGGLSKFKAEEGNIPCKVTSFNVHFIGLVEFWMFGCSLLHNFLVLYLTVITYW